MGKAGGMAFGKTVFAEPLDLVEAAPGEVFGVTALDHAAHHLFLQPADGAAAAEGGHGLAQLVELAGGEFGGHHGKLHGLFLEQRHALGAPEHGAQFIGVTEAGIGGGIIFRLQPVAAAQVGMHHVALDGAGADDRHLDDEVIKAARLQARQHVHLGAAFHLEDAHRIGPAQHVVDAPVLARHAGEGVFHPVPGLDEGKAFADAGEHAERQHVDFQDAESVDVVLVPLDEGAFGHGGIADGHGFIEPLAGEHEAAHMLGEVAGKAGDLA